MIDFTYLKCFFRLSGFLPGCNADAFFLPSCNVFLVATPKFSSASLLKSEMIDYDFFSNLQVHTLRAQCVETDLVSKFGP